MNITDWMREGEETRRWGKGGWGKLGEAGRDRAGRGWTDRTSRHLQNNCGIRSCPLRDVPS